MSALVSFLWRNYKCHYPSEVSKQNDALRIGLLGASKIAPPAVISPAKSHPEVIVVAVAARDPKRAQAYAKKYRIPIVHDSYQTLLDDPAIDAIYIALPPGHHYEWAIKALKAEKHVLLEKPSVSNAEEAAKLFRSPLLSKTGSPVLLEAFHYRFYPAWQKLLSLIDPANIVEAHSASYLPKGIIPLYDIRCTYNVSILRQVFGTEPDECLEASYRGMPPGHDKEIDQAFTARWRFPNGGIGSMVADMIADGGYSIPMMHEFPRIQLPKLEIKHREVIVEDKLPSGQEHAVQKTVIFWNYLLPHIYHRIDILEQHTIRSPSGDRKVVKSWTETSYVKEYSKKDGPDSITTYSAQLEDFVNKIKKRPVYEWVALEDSVKQMEMIDNAYKKAGLPIRPSKAGG
ncbi:MAG: hypothetical protein LQ343_004461 [Gyalolechia ehrenbergii]|nr:MAG: hypothetical protein LQ343_004461 [Gyalolechia ehrenbergii]